MSFRKTLCTTYSAQSKIYLCTSIYEPFGLAPLEAALCGCAVVANDIPSLREVWSDGALFFNCPESLADVMHTLQDPDELRQARARSSRRAQWFTAARMTEAYLAVFDSLLLSKAAALTGGVHAA